MIPFFGNEANGDKKKKPATQISAAGYKKAISEFTVSRRSIVSQIEKEFRSSNQISFSDQHERQVHLNRFSIIQFFNCLVILFKYHPPF